MQHWKPLWDAPEEDKYGWDLDYDKIVKSFRYDLLASVTLGSYQGDILYLLQNGDQYGFLCVGYGSCSGCDALEACDTRADVEQLRKSLHDDIVWIGDRTTTLKWLVERDWEGQYYGNDPDVKTFVLDAVRAIR